MAPRKGKETLLELCTATTTLGNTIAVHLVEYLSITKTPSHGFKELAVEFLETSRILFPAKAGLTETARTGTQFPSDIMQELRERFHQTNTVFVVLNQLVNKFLEKLVVYSPTKTRVIAIQFTSRDPALAARAANTVAQLYLQEQNDEF